MEVSLILSVLFFFKRSFHACVAVAVRACGVRDLVFECWAYLQECRPGRGSSSSHLSSSNCYDSYFFCSPKPFKSWLNYFRWLTKAMARHFWKVRKKKKNSNHCRQAKQRRSGATLAAACADSRKCERFEETIRAEPKLKAARTRDDCSITQIMGLLSASLVPSSVRYNSTNHPSKTKSPNY